jgi:aspartate/methionine/tyrosine aminotransferase
MRWAKRNLTGFTPNNLGMSGLPGLSAADVAPAGPTPYWMPEGAYGDPELRGLIAAREGGAPDHVFVSAGTSLANFLVYLAEARGAHVAVETPAYEALPALPAAVSATCTAFRRDPARGWRIDAASLRAAVRPNTRLIVVTDLHNPIGVRIPPEDLALLLAEAERVGAAVLVDEVYREMDLVPRPTAARAHPRVIVTNSLTKAHGLGGLRIGWILATPDRIERIAGWNDLVCPAHPVPSIAVAKAYLAQADARIATTRAMIADRLGRADAWVRGRGDVAWTRPDGGITGFLRLPAGTDGAAFAAHAFATEGVRVIPGAFFQAPDHVRISYGLPVEDLERALLALGRALDAWIRR